MPKGKTQGWLRRLEDERLEIFMRCDDYPDVSDTKIRASGTETDMLELVEWFEEKTGFRVESPILPRRPRPPIPGQISLLIEESSVLQGGVPLGAELSSLDATLSPMPEETS